MSDQLIEVGEGFWNIRGSFRIAGVLDIGTQCSLVRLANGRFILLDAYTLSGQVKREVDELTDGGADIEAILNLHPFHTVHVEWAHRAFPGARLYGTRRHQQRLADLPWEPERTEGKALQKKYAGDLEFSVPRGVDFISADENVHFSSVLACHPASGTLHVDDTLMYLRLPGIVRALGLGDSVSFHPTLARALLPRAGAAAEFRDWAVGVFKRWAQAENLCAAHTGALLAAQNQGAPLQDRLHEALDKVASTLDKHQQKYG